MLNHALSALQAAAIAALVSNFLVPLTEAVASAVGAIDAPGGRRTHQGEVARLGGLAIAGALVLGSGSVSVMRWSQWGGPIPRPSLVALMLGAAMVFMVGLVDDVVGVSSIKKLVVQVVAAGMLVNMGWSFNVLGMPGGGEISLGVFSIPLTVLWIVGVTNAVNFIDGLDGLATGVVAIIGASFLVYALMLGNPFTVVVTAGIVGACLGFLPYNRRPARVFLGDAGSLSLGFLLGAVSVQTALKAPAAVAILVPLLALGVPVMDALLVMLVRFLERPKGTLFRRFLRMFHADRNHLHHLLESFVTTHRRAVHAIYAMVLVSSVMALIVAMTKQQTLGVALIVVELIAVAAVRQLGLARRASRLTRSQREAIEEDLHHEMARSATENEEESPASVS